jgi:hypothetical protein
MEASAAAGQAAPAGDAAGEAQGQEQQGQEQQQPDLASIQQQLSELGPSLEQMRGMLTEQQEAYLAQQQQQQDPAEPEPQQPEIDLSYMDPDNPAYNPQLAAQSLAQIMEQQSQQQVQAALAPLQEQVANMEAQRQADLLAAEFPELQDPDVAQNVIQVSRDYAKMLGQPELGDNPAFWRIAYMAGRAADVANGEQQEQPAAATLEGAGGASPAGAADQQQQLVQGILSADGAGRSVLPFG